MSRVIPPTAEPEPPPTYRDLRRVHGLVKAAFLYLLYRGSLESVARHFRRRPA